MGRKVGVGSSAEDITRFHLGPCPRGHLTPSTMSPSRASFQAINVLGAQPSGCPPPLPSLLHSPSAQFHNLWQASPSGGELSQELGKCTP